MVSSTMIKSPWVLFGLLLEYPTLETPKLIEQLVSSSSIKGNDLQEALSQFQEFLEQNTLASWEEAYIQVFDFNTDSALEVGWHLFGEDYGRGTFLVKMRQLLHQYNIPEVSELPDHLLYILPLLEKLPMEESKKLVHESIAPALLKIMPVLEKKESPYLDLLTALQLFLRSHYPVSKGDTVHA